MKASLLTTAAIACTFATVASAQRLTPAQQKQDIADSAAQKKAAMAVSPLSHAKQNPSQASAFVGPNDACTNATAVSGPGPFAFDTVGATTDGPAACGAIGNDVWFNWTAGATTTHTISICTGSPNFDTVLAVYGGAGCPVGAQIVCNDDFCGLASQVNIAATMGSVYKVRIGGFNGATGTGSFSVTALPPPAGNDGCGMPVALAGPGPHPFDTTSSTTGAEGQSESGCLAFGTTAINNDSWFTWMAGFTGTAQLTVCGQSSVDTKVAIWPGAPACPVSGTSLACNDDVCGLQSQLSWPVTSGTSYTIQMGTFPGAAGGTGTFTIMAGPPPPTNDPCSNPDIIAGSGPFNFDSSQATTGAEGQSEAICNFFATTAINNDQWYRWTAPSSGQATLTVCGQSSVDTKAAVYPGTPQCPTAGSALTCNDDSCGLQSTLCWQVTSGSSYTIQMGTFPNATGGTGTFTINVAAGGPSACQIDDGTSEDALGFTAGGELAWIQRFGGGGSTNLTNVQVSWGTPAFPGGAPGNGSPVKVLVYNDPNNDGDPSDAVLIQQINTTVANVDTDIFNTIPITPVVLNGVFFVGAGQIHASGQFVAPMDQGCPQPAVAWLFGDNTGAAVNYANPAANVFPPQTFDSVGFPANVMVRAGCTVSPMTQFCLPGSGGIIPCPCSNPPAGGGLGCNNFSAGPADSGTLNATGISSLGADSVVLAATGENNTSLTVFWQGRDPVHPTGLPHGAGVRCVTATLKRLYIGNASAGAISRPGMGDASVSARAAAVGDPISAGQNRHYFTIYRDPNAAGPCGNTASTVNLTNAGTINWSM